MDLEKIRRETPGVDHVVHLNACGAGLMPRPVLDCLHGHLDLEARIGGYEAEDQCAAAIEHSYAAIAALLNCQPSEIAIVENATVAWSMAFYGMAFQAGDKILTTVSEYASNYIAYLQMHRRAGIEVVVVPNDADGQMDVAALENRIDKKTKLISVTHAPTNGGLVNPAAAIGRVARAAGVPYLLDACQSIGQMPLDVEKVGCDMLSATGRKYLRGPRGTGFLYVRKSMLEHLEPPFLDLHSATWSALDDYQMRPDTRRFENWENYVAGKIGLGVAVDYALNLGLDNIARRVQTLATKLRDEISAINGAEVHDLGKEKSGIVSFSLANIGADDLVAAMAVEKINIHSSTVVSTRADMEPRGITALNRLGVHYYNSEAEVDRFIEALRRLAGG